MLYMYQYSVSVHLYLTKLLSSLILIYVRKSTSMSPLVFRVQHFSKELILSYTVNMYLCLYEATY